MVAAGAVLFFATLLALDQGATIDSQRVLNGLMPGQYRVPLALPALVCMVFIFALAFRVSAEAGPSTGTTPSKVTACYPAVPLLVLVLAGQTTVLRDAHRLGWARAWLPLATG
jgi:hypothetical protein